MKIRDEIDHLVTAIGSMATDLKERQEKLLFYARSLESLVADRMADPAIGARMPGPGLAPDGAERSLTERITRLHAENDTLRNQVVALSRHNREITLLSTLNDFLHNAASEAEAYSIIAEVVPRLFPGDSGAAFALNASRNMLEAAAVWGPMAPPRLIFRPDDCWAHRRGQVHLAVGHEQSCPHATDHGRTHVCLPLLAQGETLGILHLIDGAAISEPADEARTVQKCRLAKTLADNIGLGIGNLRSRDSIRNPSIRAPLSGPAREASQSG